MWLREFGTTKTKIELAAGCKCQFANGIIQIDSDTEKWQIRYSKLLEQIVLYHKKRTLRRALKPDGGFNLYLCVLFLYQNQLFPVGETGGMDPALLSAR